MRAGNLVLASLVLALASCESTSPGTDLDAGLVTIRPAAEAYAPGDVVRATLHNNGHRPIRMGICFRSLFRLEAGGRWVEDRLLRDVCPAVLQVVDGYSSFRLGALLPVDLPPGRYRLLKDFMAAGESRLELSAPFEVE